MGERARLGHRRGRTAAPLGVILRVGPQLERDGNRLGCPARTAAPRPSCRRRRSSRRASVRRRPGAPAWRGPRAAAPRARASASPASSAAWILAVLRPPSSSAIAAGPIRAASSRCRPRTSVTAALPAAVAAPHPSAVEPSVGDPFAVGGEREADLIAAGAAVGRDGEVPIRHVPEALRRGQVMLKRECVHPREDRTVVLLTSA